MVQIVLLGQLRTRFIILKCNVEKRRGEILKMKKRRMSFFILLFIFIIVVLNSTVYAAGINGTTIVLNPRTWWKLDRLCKCFKEISGKRCNFKNC